MDSQPVTTIAPTMASVDKKPSLFRRFQFKPAFPLHSRKQRLLFLIVVLLGVIGAVAGYRVWKAKTSRINVSEDSITLRPLKEDTLGVEEDSGFVLTSREPIDESSLRNSLKVDPEVKLDIDKKGDREFIITPKDPLNSNSVYQFTLATGGIGDLAWAFQVKGDFKVVQTLPRAKATNVPVNSGIEITFSHDNFGDIDQYFEISPKTEGRFERHKRTISFVPKSLTFGTLYTVKLKKGVSLNGSTDVLKEDVSFQFETQQQTGADYRIGFTREFSEFSTQEKPAFTLYLSRFNESTLSVTTYKYKSKEAFKEALNAYDAVPPWAQYSRTSYLTSTDGLEKVNEFTAPIQNFQYSGYFIFPEPLAKGYYVVQAKQGNYTIQSWLQVTNLASYLSVSKTKTLMWLNDVGTKKALPGATVTVEGSEKEYKANQEGVIVFDTPEALSEGQESYIEVNANGETAIVPVQPNTYYSNYWWGGLEGASGHGDDYWSYLYVDRPLYQPTDTVKFWGVIKNRENLKPPDKITVEVTGWDYYDYFYNQSVLTSQELTPTSLGTFTGEVPIKNLRTGYYTIRVKDSEDFIVSTNFNVETYTKPAYKIEVQADKKAVFAGEQVSFKGRTLFYEGTSVPNVALKYGGIKSGALTTNETGSFNVDYQTQYREPTNTYSTSYPTFENISLSPELAEEGEIEGSSGVRVFGPRIHMDYTTDVSSTNAKIVFDVKSIVLDRLNNGTAKNDEDFLGNPVSGQIISGTFYERSWDKIEKGEYYDFINKTVQKQYRYQEVKKALTTLLLTTDNNGKTGYEFPLEPDKSYFLEVEAKDQDGRREIQTIYIYSSPIDYGTDYYFLKEDNSVTQSKSVNQQVTLHMASSKGSLPEGGDNKYLYRFAQRGIRGYEIKDNPNLSFNFKDEYVPNVIVRGIYFTGSTYIESESYIVAYKKEDKKLGIEVNLSKSSYEPQDTAKLDVFVKDKDNKGVASEVNVSLVDEALFELSPHVADPLGSLYKLVTSGVTSSYASHQYPLEKSLAEGGGCFLAGTQVLIPGNKTKSIEDIRVGDTIVTKQSENSPQLVEARVRSTEAKIVGDYMVINEFLRVTPEHNLYVNGRWMTAGEIKRGDHLLGRGGEWIEVTSIERIVGAVNVYNFEVENYNTYFVNNIYVHNQKGRELFMDTAYFGTIKTDATGRGSVEIKLPDNLTSWRATLQGISQAMEAGDTSTQIAVKMPFFVDMVLNNEYVLADKPMMKVRALGEGLTQGQKVDYTLEAPTLTSETKKFSAQGFETVTLELPPLQVGEHKITLTGKSGSREDILTRTIKVTSSRLTRRESDFSDTLESNITTGETGGDLLFTDRGRGQFYHMLANFAFTYGDRVEQKLARVKARDLLTKYFNEQWLIDETFKPAEYQTPEGGVAILPYSDADLVVSAQVANISPESIDTHALSQYFYTILNSKDEGVDRMAQALFGLAALKEPVLVPVNNLLQRNDLTVKDTLYLGLAQASLGARQEARATLKTILELHAEDMKPFIRIKVDGDKDDMLEATALASELASMTGLKEGDNLFKYTQENFTHDILTYLERLTYITQSLNALPATKAEFAYTIPGKERVVKKLEPGESYKIQATAEEIAGLKLENIQGLVGVVSYFDRPLNQNDTTDTAIHIAKNYKVADNSTFQFNENDLIEVILTYSLGGKANDGCFQVTDILPSGLKPVTKLNSWHLDPQTEYSYPYNVSGQKVSFCLYKGVNKPIRYFARVTSKGQFVSEPTLMQSLQSTDSFTISNPGTITIQ